MYMFNVMLVNRKNKLVASKLRKVDELRVNEERQIKQAAKPQVSERTKQLAELSRQKSKKPSHVPEVVDEEKSDKESPKNQPKRSDSIH
jgi:DNA-binding protein H-NS